MDLISGDADGCFNVFIQRDSGFEAFYKYRLLNGDTLDAGTQSVPTVADWNRDGRRDLIIGIQASRILLYLNQTSDTWPMFQNWSYIYYANGFPIILGRSAPAVVDLDRDGKQDLLSGEGNGWVHFFRNIGSDTNPALASGETLKTVSGVPLRPDGIIKRDSKIGVGDWNNDGYFDILICGDDGLVTLYLGVPETGVEDDLGLQIPAHRLRVEPNPAQRHVRVSWTGQTCKTSLTELRLYDASGCLVLPANCARVGASSVVLELGGLAPGAYFACLTATHQTETASFVVAK